VPLGAEHARGDTADVKKIWTVLSLMLVLSACQTRAGSHFVVNDGSTKISFQLAFVAEGAEAVAPHEDEISALIEKRTGAEVKIDRSNGTRFIVETNIETLVAQKGITGVKAASVTDLGNGETQVRVELTAPGELMAAIANGVSNEADATALREAALGTTEVGASVSMGEISSVTFTDATGAALEVPTDGRVAEAYFDLSHVQPGTLVVTGHDAPDTGGVNKLALFGAAAVMAGIAFGLKRSKQR
jgi:hypothetical protein